MASIYDSAKSIVDSKITWTCKDCQKKFTSIDGYTGHLVRKHGLVKASRSPKALAPNVQQPLDALRKAEHDAREAIKGLDAERDRLHARIVEIDNIVARYKKWEST